MKSLKNISNSILILTLTVVFFSCDKTISEPEKPAYIPTNLDVTAGNWRTFILTSSEEVSIPSPLAVTDAAYKKELDSLKTVFTIKLTEQNRVSIKYWGAGSVYRWNEIARELAAKYNLAPAAKADGTYPVPDAANPLAEPRFPFANPPYTARALAYLSVAQYDALVAAWKYKYKFNRKAPSKIDASILPTLPVSDLPAYPSEDAVVAGASYTVLAAMFPGEVPFLKEKLAEAQSARLWAGVNVPSDLRAGEALGRGVGVKIMAKAKTDGMSAANNQALTAGFIDGAKARGIIEIWVSQENPKRPPMLPNYGAVSTWNFEKTTLTAIRPKLPYFANSPEFNIEKAELDKINKSQTGEQAKVASFWSDGAGSYTPPGHWARAAADLCYENKFSEVNTARTMALTTTAMMDAGIACWETKYYYYTPRPQQFGIKTSVGLPNFPSYTSGHSTFSAAASTVLGSIFPTKAADLNAMAKEASESRLTAKWVLFTAKK